MRIWLADRIIGLAIWISAHLRGCQPPGPPPKPRGIIVVKGKHGRTLIKMSVWELMNRAWHLGQIIMRWDPLQVAKLYVDGAEIERPPEWRDE